MAVAVAAVKEAEIPKFRTITDVTCDSSYQSEGEPLTATQLNLASVDFAQCYLKNGDEAKEAELFVTWAFYDPVKELLHLYNGKTGKEVASTKNMEKVVVRVIAWGTARVK